MRKDSEPNVVSRLMDKVAQQADDLRGLSTRYEEASAHGKKCEQRISELEGSLFAQARSGAAKAVIFEVENVYKTRVVKLEQQLRHMSSKVADLESDRNTIRAALEERTHEAHKWRSMCTELRADNEALSLCKGKGAHAADRYATSEEGSTSASLVYVLQKNLRQSELRNAELENRVIAERRAREDVSNEVFVLKNALDDRLREEGITEHHELVALVAKLRGELSALHEQHRGNLVQLRENQAKRVALEDKCAKLSSQVDAQQRDMDRLEGEVKTLAGTDQTTSEKIRSLQQERDVLLDFIQTDMQKSAALGSKLEAETKAFKDTEAALVSVSSRVDAADAAAREVDGLREDLRLRRLEIEELTKMEAELVSQGRSKQEALSRQQSELAAAAAKTTELEAQVSVMREDGRVLRGELGELQQESERLRRDNADLRADVQRLQGSCMQLDDLTAELNALAVPTSDAIIDREMKTQAPEPVLDASGNLVMSAMQTQLESPVAPLASSAHAKWVATPALRLMSDILYQRVRGLFKDLCASESRVVEVEEALVRESRRAFAADSERDAVVQKMGPLEENMQSTVLDFRSRVRDMESELLSLRPCKAALDRVREAILTAPGIRDVLLDPNVVEGKVPILDSHLSDVLTSLLSMGARTTSEALSRNEHILKLKSELEEKCDELKMARMELAGREEALAAMMAREKLEESERETYKRVTRTELEAALDLAEKQNKLTTALEARVEAMQKEVTYRVAQVKTLSGREETARVQLCGTLRRFTAAYSSMVQDPPPMGRIEAPTEDSRLPVLQHWLNSLLQRVLSSLGGSMPLMAGDGAQSQYKSAPGVAVPSPGHILPPHDVYGDGLQATPYRSTVYMTGSRAAYASKGHPHVSAAVSAIVQSDTDTPSAMVMEDDPAAHRETRKNLQRRLEQAKSTFMALQQEEGGQMTR